MTALGRRYTSPRFIDASGSAASFLARQFKLRFAQYGPRKIAIWTYFNIADWQEGTTLYTEAIRKQYLEWTWEIPVTPGTISVGYVATGASIGKQRAAGVSVEDIFAEQLRKFLRFRALLNEGSIEMPSVTAFTCRVHKGVCGPNWLIAGGAAFVPDPITGNGVAAALRHAAEAAKLILKFRKRGRLPWWACLTYRLRVLHMGKIFNSLIEKLAYDWPVRGHLGLGAGETSIQP